MPIRIPFEATALLLAGALASLPACDDWECGYGGPGCSPPALSGVCADSAAAAPTVLFFDDTGDHPTDVYSAASSSPDVLDASVSEERLRLTGLREGRVDVMVESRGFEDVGHVFELAVDDTGRVVPADVTDCSASSLLSPARTVALGAPWP